MSEGQPSPGQQRRLWNGFKRAGRWLAVFGGLLLATSIGTYFETARRFPFPVDALRSWPTSVRVTDRDGFTLLETVGRDGQWRQPVALSDMSPWLIKATIAAEDERFESHAGVDPLAVLRAAAQNVQQGRVKSGASTLSMQLCRMVEDRPRTWTAKLIEAVRATEIEQSLSKHDILAEYLNLAPYGGNIRGAEAAARFYFQKPASELSLGEAALLVGVPQSPNRLRPDRHPEAAKRRREYVLQRMHVLGLISELERQAANDEPVVIRREPVTTPSAVGVWALQRRPAGGTTTIQRPVQRLVEEAVHEHQRSLPTGSDVAVVVIDIPTSEIVACVGSANAQDPVDGQVNGVTARRSPGSALKPFVYAAAFEARRLKPDSMLDDSPMSFGEWAPDNFDREFTGPITVAEALRTSRNIPAIQVTRAIGLDRCLGVLESAGVSLPPATSRRSGLTLATGGIEVTLLDLTNAYATLGRAGQRSTPKLFVDETTATTPAISPDVCAALNDILATDHRHPRGLAPGTTLPWFMWKTGTSSARRDAWAIGHNGRYAIGVWAGRFNGVGDHHFTGRDAAEPLLARLFVQPALRHEHRPPSPRQWEVQDALPATPRPVDRIAIQSPSSGSVLISLNGRAVVRPRLSSGLVEDEMHWFLNSEHLGARLPDRLELAPGSYELRCVSSLGQTAASRFRIE